MSCVFLLFFMSVFIYYAPNQRAAFFLLRYLAVICLETLASETQATVLMVKRTCGTSSEIISFSGVFVLYIVKHLS